MIALHTILCPVDFSEATAHQVALAAGLARVYGARLVLHHNLAALASGAGVGWMWSGDHQSLSQETAGARLELLARETAPELAVELSLTEGSATTAVLTVSEAINADLIVLSTHHATTDDHTSVATEVLKRTHRSVLALHDGGEPDAVRFDLGSDHLQVALVPTDLTRESRAAVDFAFELSRTLPLDVRLLHLVPPGLAPLRHEGSEATAEAQIRALIPEDLRGRTRVYIRGGDPARGIVRAATDLAAACIVMGEHTRAPLRRWFTPDTSGSVLHDAPCPVWYVPGQQIAA